MNYVSVLETIVQSAINFIVVTSITNSSQQKTVTDVKTDLRTTKEDLMSELKDSRENILTQIEMSMQQGKQNK